MAESGVPLDEEQYQVLLTMNRDPDPLFCISALAGTGKTAVAHCALRALMEEHASSSPRCLVIYTAPTRALREEVVMELCKPKAALAACVCKLP